MTFFVRAVSRPLRKVRLPDPACRICSAWTKNSRLDHSADAGFEIEKIIPAPAFVRDPDEHVLDLPHEIGTPPAARQSSLASASKSKRSGPLIARARVRDCNSQNCARVS